MFVYFQILMHMFGIFIFISINFKIIKSYKIIILSIFSDRFIYAYKPAN